MRFAVAVLAALLLLAGGPSATAANSTAGVVRIEVLSNRADLVSGGDALVEVLVPPGADAAALRVDVGGRDVTSMFAVRPTGRFMGLVTGLVDGANRLTATLPDGRGAHITITSHPISGPVFSGPHIEPWRCAEGAEDEHCNRPPAYDFSYKSTAGGPLRPYDPASPPSNVAETTTDEGETVPFIVRRERGVLARDSYQIAVLFDPDEPWEPWAPQRGFNHKLVITHGASCDTSYAQGSAPDVMNEAVLGRGFAVMSHALNNAGHNCNIVTQAESMIMTKEHLVERYGELRYTIGTGCSGGALAQYQTANAYPGLYQGISPACSYPDAWSSAMQYVDYVLLREYFENPQRWGVPWSPHQMGLVNGHPNLTNPITFTEVIPNSGNPSRDCPGVPPEDVYDAESNPDGVRCTLQDYMRNIFGLDPADGFAQVPWDNTGVQYGLEGLLDGQLLPAQFVDLNTKVGGPSRDFWPLQAGRAEGHAFALDALYRSGANNTAEHLDEVAIIDLRGPDPGAFHDVYRTYALRDRLVRQHGHADNMALWRGSVPLLGDATYTNTAIFALDEWLAAVEADGRNVPLADKIVQARPASAADRCSSGGGQEAPSAHCDAVVEAYSTPRMVAGMPSTDDVQKCALKPLVRADYPGLEFTDEEWAALNEAFPTGVCDWSRPDPHFQPTVAWLTYADEPGGRPMGPAPVSIPFGPAGGVVRPATDLPATGAGVALAALAVLVAGALAAQRRPRSRE